MNFVCPPSIVSIALNCHGQINIERIIEWLAIVQSLQTLGENNHILSYLVLYS